MKYLFLLFTGATSLIYSQQQPKKLTGKWSFSKRICVNGSDTIVQVKDPRLPESSDTTRPYTEIEFFPDNHAYNTEISYFKCKPTLYLGIWFFTENEISFLKFHYADPTPEFGGKIQLFNKEELIIVDKNGCTHYFQRKQH